jgi:EpsI family protein
MKRSSIKFAVLLIAILGAGAVVNTWTYLGEAHVDRKSLKAFPEKIGAWQKSNDQTIDEPTMKVLRASDYLLRDFRRSDGVIGNFYVGYYASQREGVSYHSPLNCLPGSGWMLSEPGKVSIPGPSGGSNFIANKYVIQNGNYRSLMIYWYQGRGRAVASEYWGKIYTVIDSVRLRRSDGALVRVTVPISGSEEKALEAATDLARSGASALGEFVPN